MQLNLNFLSLTVPEDQIWEKLDDKQKQLATSAITRILVKAATHTNNVTDISNAATTHLSHSQLEADNNE